jgi:alpha-glucoside transport system permease protein
MINRIQRLLTRTPLHLIIILLCVVWITPTVGVFVTSLRPRQRVLESGWWTVVLPRRDEGHIAYEKYCAQCHGPGGQAVDGVDLTSPDLLGQFTRSVQLQVLLQKPLPDGRPHVETMPTPQELVNILDYLRRESGVEQQQPLPRFTIQNYVDTLMGYVGQGHWVDQCTAGGQTSTPACAGTGLTSPSGMARAFINSVIVSIPATILPLLLAAFAGYAFSWFAFPGRQWMFVILVGLQIVPLQMTLIPIYRIYANLGLTGTFLGIWLFHTGFGLPYAIYLTRNFMSALPRDLFESVYLDGASHWTAFWQLAIPLSVPALASLGIFQFLWVWNDLLVALVFLGSERPVLTWQINSLVGRFTGEHLLAAAAFISMILPMIVFFSMQRYFVRGLMAGAVKG